MDGYTHEAFRRYIRTFCQDIVLFTEFTYANAIHSKSQPAKISRFRGDEPIVAQIYGKEIDKFVTAAKILEQMGFCGVDLNMGCPSRVVVKSEHGMALRQNPALAANIVQAVSNAVSIPVSVKTRLGVTDASDLISFAKSMEEAGAKAFIVHARTYIDPYGAQTHWEELYKLKDSIKIPVIGNGSIDDRDSGMRTRLQNLDGLMIGRAAVAEPWRILPQSDQPKSPSEIWTWVIKRSESIISHRPNGIHEARGLLLKSVPPYQSDLRTRIKSMTTTADWENCRAIIVSMLGSL